jgi:thymidylate synthase
MLPVLLVEGDTLPEVWEKSVLRVWREGVAKPTEYDIPGEPPSREATMILVIRHPLQEPRIHRCFPGALRDLEVYRQEVVDGLHDHWVRSSETAWTYTYHQRLTAWNVDNVPLHMAGEVRKSDDQPRWVSRSSTPGAGGIFVDQIAYAMEKLVQAPHSRRAQAVTWNATVDPATDDPPCLQRIWMTITESDGKKCLNFNNHWRSRDAFKAAFMNIWALIDWFERIAAAISEKMGEKIELGRYVDMIDSYHIYGKYFREFEGFVRTVETRSFEERVWTLEEARDLGMFD